MNKNDRYSDCSVLGVAIKRTGDILKPILNKEKELLELIDSIKSENHEMAWYPLNHLISLFEIAENNNFVERLAKSWAVLAVRLMRKQGGINTPEKALMTIASGFKMQHQGNTGSYSVSMKNSTTAEIVDSSYSPCGYLIGLAELTIANYGAVNTKVLHLPGDCRNQGAPVCKYKLTWEESNLLRLRNQNNA